VLDEQGKLIKITVNPEMDQESGTMTRTKVTAEPRDMNSIPGHGQDHRTLEKLFNGVDNTTDDNNMWLIPFNKGENHLITIDFGQLRTISALRFFNYNKSEEDSLRGTKQVIIKLDDRYLTPKRGITLRKAPGLMEGALDIGQEVKLPFMQGWTNEQIGPMQSFVLNPISSFQEYETVGMPMGYMIKINLYSTHGDFYYIGLNGIELFDQNGRNLLQQGPKFKLFASPAGVHTIAGMEQDVRKMENLIDGNNTTSEERHIWLTLFRNTRTT
jgi:protein JBTS26